MLEPLFGILGVAVIGKTINIILEETGNGKLNWLVNVGMYCAGAWIMWEPWWELVRYVDLQFIKGGIW